MNIGRWFKRLFSKKSKDEVFVPGFAVMFKEWNYKYPMLFNDPKPTIVKLKFSIDNSVFEVMITVVEFLDCVTAYLGYELPLERKQLDYKVFFKNLHKEMKSCKGDCQRCVLGNNVNMNVKAARAVGGVWQVKDKEISDRWCYVLGQIAQACCLFLDKDEKPKVILS